MFGSMLNLLAALAWQKSPLMLPIATRQPFPTRPLACHLRYIELLSAAAGGGDSEGIYYQGITGMKADMSGARLYPAIAETAQERQPANQLHAPESDSGAEDSEDGSDSAASSCTDVDEAGSADKGQPPSHEQRQQQRKAHKKCVKEEKRQRRMTKTPKKVKKKAEKKGKQHK